MATQEGDLLLRLRQKALGIQSVEEEEDEKPPAPRGMHPDLARKLGYRVSDPVINHPSYRRTDHDNGFLGSLGEGLVGGLLEPFRIVPFVDEYLREHEDPDQVGLAENVGYGLGYMASFMVPATGALKIGAAGVKSAQLLRVAKATTKMGAEGKLALEGLKRMAPGAIAGASALDDIGRGANFARGAFAGGLLGAGMTSPDQMEDPVKLFKNTVIGAATGGVGDVIAYPLARAVTAAARGTTKRLEEVFRRRTVADAEEGALLGRAMKMAEELFPSATLETVEVSSRFGQLEGGLARLGLEELQEGEVRILHSLAKDGGDLRPIVQNLDGMEVHSVKRKIGKDEVEDILVTPEGDVGKEIVKRYRENLERDGIPWLPGQQVRHVPSGTNVKLISRGKEAGKVKGQVAGKKGFEEIDISQTIPLPLVRWEAKVSRVVPDADNLWKGFSQQHGEFVQSGDWYDRAYSWVKDNAPDLTPAQRDNLVSVFARRSMNALAREDPALGRILENLTKVKPKGDVGVKEWAGSNGYMTSMTFNLRTGKHEVTLIDALPGSSTAGTRTRFQSAEAAIEFLRNNPREIPDMIPRGLNVPYNHLGFTSGASIQEVHSAATLGGVKWPTLPVLFERALPRAAFLRFMADTLEEHGIPLGRQIFQAFDDLSMGIKQSRLAQDTWVKGLAQIRGGTGFRTKIREDKLQDVTDMMSLPKREWDGFAKEKGIYAREVSVMDQLRDMWDNLFEFMAEKGVIDIDAEEFLTEYLPHLRHEAAGQWEDTIRKKFEQQGKEISEQAVRYLRRVERRGEGVALEGDPFIIPLRLIRSTFSDLHLQEPFKRLRDVINRIPEASPQLKQIKDSLIEYEHLAYSQNPEAYQILRTVMGNFLEKNGLRLEEGTIDRLVNNFASMNYGAFMSFRVGLALRNLTQTIFITAPLIQDPVALGQALVKATQKNTRDYWTERGALTVNSVAAPMEDAVYFTQMMRGFKRAGKGGKAASVGIEAVKTGEKVGRFGLKLYTGADEFNRVLAAEAQRIKSQKAWNRYAAQESKHYRDVGRFNRDSGLGIFGEAQTQIFWEKVETEGVERALDWIGVQAANETQWIYQLGAGPAWMSHGVGRLAGMYGTWPSWLGSHLLRGTRIEDPILKAKFFGYTLAGVGALTATTAATGINLSRWGPLTSFAWTGGPAVDWLKDYMDIASGFRPNQPPTANRAIALSRIGLRDRGNSAHMFLQLDPREGHGLDFQRDEMGSPIPGMAKMVRSILEPFTPGALFVNDVEDMIEVMQGGGDMRNAMLEVMGLPPIAGLSWPQWQ